MDKIRGDVTIRAMKLQNIWTNFLNIAKFKWLVLGISGFLILFFVFFHFYSIAYKDQVFPRVMIGSVNLGGKTQPEVKTIIEELIKKRKSTDLKIISDNQAKTIPIEDIELNYDLDRTVETAFSVGRQGSFLRKFIQRLRSVVASQQTWAVYHYKQEVFDIALAKMADKIDQLPEDVSAQLSDGKVEILEAKDGIEINRKLFRKKLIYQLASIDPGDLQLSVEKIKPLVIMADTNFLQEKTDKLIDQELILKSDDEQFRISSAKIASWLEFVAATDQDGKYLLFPRFNEALISQTIAGIASEIDSDPVDAVLGVSGGKVIALKKSSQGRELNQEKTLEDIRTAIYQGKPEVTLEIKVTEPRVNEAKISEMGLEKLIGKATTNFGNSPENRRHNISQGAKQFNGTLIKPGEEFSFLKTLGDVSEKTGYLPELVIKEDRTEPEVGGGLCQVSTTMFRAALNSGLKITARQNHKYRVSYYEPPVGMDATVYIPSPDLKFKNDTPGYILIQAKISGSSITFEFWGKSDGRKVEMTDPEVYDITEPEGPIYEDDPTLPVGEEKQVEKAHPGSKAKFTYKVTKDGKIINEQEFKSEYVPWRARIKKGTKTE